MGIDISDRKRIEEELYARNEELEAFAYTISHDLLTPAAVMEGYAKTVLEADAEGRTEAEKECLEGIIRGARRMCDLIESLLQYAQAGHLKMESENVDPNSVLKETLLDLGESIAEKGVGIEVDGVLPAVYLGSMKLHQVFLNLVKNAIQHTGDVRNSKIEIGVSQADKSVTFFVRDNGVGIPLEIQKKIFEPFKNFSGAGTGLGIGMATVRRAVETWGGEILVDSVPGEGTTFFFTAPTVA